MPRKGTTKMVTLRAMIDDVGTRKVVVPAKDADKTIKKFMQTGFKKENRFYSPNTIKYIDIVPIPE